MSSADGKHFGPRSGPREDQDWQSIGRYLDLNVWQSEGVPDIFFSKTRYRENSADDKNHEKFSNKQRVIKIENRFYPDEK